MNNQHFDMIFVGGGLAALMMLRELGSALPARLAVIDDARHTSPVHWSYWSDTPSYYDRFAIGEWRAAHIGGRPTQSIAPLTLRVVRSADVLADLRGSLQHVTFIRDQATAISHEDGMYAIRTGRDRFTTDQVFDSAVGLPPVFPADEPRAMLSGTGIIVDTDEPIFDPTTATLFDALPSGGFAYLLPLSPTEALVESAHFLARPRPADPQELLAYLRRRFGDIGMDVSHQEHGVIPLGFAPPANDTSGPRHILLGTKRGLVKPSAGYGILAIERESAALARLWRQGKPLPPSQHYRQPWQLLDRTFLELVAGDPAAARQLMRLSMELLPLRDALRFLDGHLSVVTLARLMKASFPVVSPYISKRIRDEITKHVQ